MIYDESENSKLCMALKSVGIEVNSVYDLVNSQSKYDVAIPILIDWLPIVKSDRMREGIARALTVKGIGSNALNCLLTEFSTYKANNESEWSAKWAIANAISEVATKNDLSKIRTLALDKKHGKAREMLIFTLGKFKGSSETLDALIKLLSDKEVRIYALLALGKQKSFDTMDAIATFLNDQDPYVRKEARKILTKLEKLQNKKG